MDERSFPYRIFPSGTACLLPHALYSSLAMPFGRILFDVHRCIARSNVPGVVLSRTPLLLSQKRAEAGCSFLAEKNEVNLNEKKIVCRKIPGISWNRSLGKLFAVADSDRAAVEFGQKTVVKSFSIAKPVFFPVEYDSWDESVFYVCPIRFAAEGFIRLHEAQGRANELGMGIPHPIGNEIVPFDAGQKKSFFGGEPGIERSEVDLCCKRSEREDRTFFLERIKQGRRGLRSPLERKVLSDFKKDEPFFSLRDQSVFL